MNITSITSSLSRVVSPLAPVASFVLSLVVFVALVSGCKTSCLTDMDMRGFSVKFEKGACFGQCPTYTATIYGDRQVNFESIAFIDPPRAVQGTISDDAMCELLDELEASSFTTTESAMANVADAPTTRITITRGAMMHTVQWNLTVPKNLRKLHDLLEAQTFRNPSLLNPAKK